VAAAEVSLQKQETLRTKNSSNCPHIAMLLLVASPEAIQTIHPT
jgi:hypothetical protein